MSEQLPNTAGVTSPVMTTMGIAWRMSFRRGSHHDVLCDGRKKHRPFMQSPHMQRCNGCRAGCES